ncbi:hypothetical protein OCU04_012440 [Sclerotinia nivalis]|uniref:BTB domain-containing protein n=1 Tax=Sclerotinia nivalis TaxID=352851 RepID=A0A9X0DCD8_9HELO|nr:hypothetical protein OCU04_012440 [Sclerotinia nivalis]
MISKTSPSDWPKRPILDYTKDNDGAFICLGTGPPDAPDTKVYHISKLRLAYHSPRLRKLFDQELKSHDFSFHRLMEPSKANLKVFCHIVQYVNTGSIIIPTQVTNDTIVSDCSNCTSASIEKRYRDGLSLSTLAHIWYLADFFMIPHCQNVTIDHMYRLLSHIATHSYGNGDFYGDSPFIIKDFIDVCQIACAAGSTADNELLTMVQQFFTFHATYVKWTPEQCELIPRTILDSAIFIMQYQNQWCREREAAGSYGHYIRDLIMVGDFFVEDKIDGGDAKDGLDSSFHFYGDNELRKKA